jgi:hypothetical protein
MAYSLTILHKEMQAKYVSLHWCLEFLATQDFVGCLGQNVQSALFYLDAILS